MAEQKELWGYRIGEAVEIAMAATWEIGTVVAVNRHHRGLDVQMATGSTFAIGSPKAVRKIPRGEAMLAWLDQ